MRALICTLALLWASFALAGEYDFDIPEAEKSPCELGGRLEMRHVHHRLDGDAVRRNLTYYNDEPGAHTSEWRALAEIRAGCRRETVQVSLLTHHEYYHAYEDADRIDKVYEAFLALTPSPNLTVEAGKRTILWGKGYAWNPAGFLNRPKDPDDPAQNLEGRLLLGADLIRSFSGTPLGNLGLTLALLPVIKDWGNTELGQDGDLFRAFKLYALWHDTDLDLIYLDGPGRRGNFGFDFSKNLKENLEVHGELGYRRDVPRTVLDARGRAMQSREDVLSYLAGARYLTATDTLFIVEYYHNGAGYDRGELEDFFAYQDAAYRQWLASGDADVMERAARLARPYYEQRNMGRDYLYLKVSQKEPFDILYFTPWAAVVVHLGDGSFNLQPGLTWTPLTDLELNLRIGIPVGAAHSDFGEKPDAFRPEIWVRYYF